MITDMRDEASELAAHVWRVTPRWAAVAREGLNLNLLCGGPLLPSERPPQSSICAVMPRWHRTHPVHDPVVDHG